MLCDYFYYTKVNQFCELFRRFPDTVGGFPTSRGFLSLFIGFSFSD